MSSRAKRGHVHWLGSTGDGRLRASRCSLVRHKAAGSAGSRSARAGDDVRGRLAGLAAPELRSGCQATQSAFCWIGGDGGDRVPSVPRVERPLAELTAARPTPAGLTRSPAGAKIAINDPADSPSRRERAIAVSHAPQPPAEQPVGSPKPHVVRPALNWLPLLTAAEFGVGERRWTPAPISPRSPALIIRGYRQRRITTSFSVATCAALCVAVLSYAATVAVSEPSNAGYTWHTDDHSTVLVCQGQLANVSCETGYVITVLRANFGRFSVGVCNENYESHWSVSCASLRSADVALKACEARNRCAIQVDVVGFGDDPCPDTEKYLELQYRCVPNAVEATAEQPAPYTASSVSPLADTPATSPPLRRPPPRPPSQAIVSSTTIKAPTKFADAPGEHRRPSSTISLEPVTVLPTPSAGQRVTTRPLAPRLSTKAQRARPPIVHESRRHSSSLIRKVGENAVASLRTTPPGSSSLVTASGTETAPPPTASILSRVQLYSGPIAAYNEAIISGASYQGRTQQDTSASSESVLVRCATRVERVLIRDSALERNAISYICENGRTGAALWRCSGRGDHHHDSGINDDNAESRWRRETRRRARTNPLPRVNPSCMSSWLVQLGELAVVGSVSLVNVAGLLATKSANEPLLGGDLLRAASLAGFLVEAYDGHHGHRRHHHLGADSVQPTGNENSYQCRTSPCELLDTLAHVASNLLDVRQRAAWSDLPRYEVRAHVLSTLLRTLEDNIALLLDDLREEIAYSRVWNNVAVAIYVVRRRSLVGELRFPDDLVTATRHMENKNFDWLRSGLGSASVTRDTLLRHAAGDLVKVGFVLFRRPGDALDLHNAHQSDQARRANGGDTSSRAPLVLSARALSVVFRRSVRWQAQNGELAHPIRVVLARGPHANPDGPSTAPTGSRCVSWDRQLARWSASGCWQKDSNATHVTCDCDRLSTYAALMTEVAASPRVAASAAGGSASVALMCLGGASLLLSLALLYLLLAKTGSANGIHGDDRGGFSGDTQSAAYPLHHIVSEQNAPSLYLNAYCKSRNTTLPAPFIVKKLPRPVAVVDAAATESPHRSAWRTGFDLQLVCDHRTESTRDESS